VFSTSKKTFTALPGPVGGDSRADAGVVVLVRPSFGPGLGSRRGFRRRPGGEAPVFAGRHWPLELRGEAVHVDLVVDFAAHHAALAAEADLLEAGLLVGPEAYAVPEILNYPSVSRCYWQRTGRTTN